ncbi:hypothetical protein [Kitasatospora sp. NPDC057015]|uniref:hypothetical protein n=1 Tax=Kitasatospora sp. NPDC057015 TaxID=3346001 RepID=UPI003630113A
MENLAAQERQEESDDELRFQGATLPHGIWSHGGELEPPGTIPSGKSRTWESESEGVLTGTEGFATYNSDAGQFVFHWDRPYYGDGLLDMNVPYGYEANVAGVQGVNIDATVVLVPPDTA